MADGKIDLVLLDVVMEEMDGFQVMESMVHNNLDTIFIVISGNNSINSAIEALRKRAYDYLRKPFEPEELLMSIKNALNQKKLKKARQQAEKEKDRLITELQKANDEIKTQKGYWEKIEFYISEHSEASFSHGICPECAKKLYPQYNIYD